MKKRAKIRCGCFLFSFLCVAVISVYLCSVIKRQMESIYYAEGLRLFTAYTEEATGEISENRTRMLCISELLPSDECCSAFREAVGYANRCLLSDCSEERKQMCIRLLYGIAALETTSGKYSSASFVDALGALADEIPAENDTAADSADDSVLSVTEPPVTESAIRETLSALLGKGTAGLFRMTASHDSEILFSCRNGYAAFSKGGTLLAFSLIPVHTESEQDVYPKNVFSAEEANAEKALYAVLTVLHKKGEIASYTDSHGIRYYDVTESGIHTCTVGISLSEAKLRAYMLS